MLTISRSQYETLGDAVLNAFKRDLIVHCKNFSPRLCEVIGDDQLTVVVNHTVEVARGYGFTKRGPIRLFAEMTLLFGSFFDTDPQYPWVSRILANPEQRTEMQLVHQLYRATLDYLNAVNGPEDSYTLQALKYLSDLSQQQLPVTQNNFTLDLLRYLHHVYPEKVQFSGDVAAAALIESGSAKAVQYGFNGLRARALLCILMFAFGHGCVKDPLYPWIARTLSDPNLPDPESRARRLERKATTWLGRVIASFEE
jgi:hypothetical protein